MYLLYILLTLTILFVLTRPFTVLFHELGHAIPAILFTRQKVSIYIGSYGDPSKSLRLTLGKLEVWYKYNSFLWTGLCYHRGTNLSVRQNIIITLCGPLASSLIAIVAFYFTFTFDFHGAIKVVAVFFLLSSLLDLYINLVPDPTPIKLYDGSTIYNDGHCLQVLMNKDSFLIRYNEVANLLNENKMEEATSILYSMLRDGNESREVYQVTINCLIRVKKYEQALTLHEAYSQKHTLSADDLSNSALIKMYLRNYDESLSDFEKSLEYNPYHKYSLNNIGYTLTIMERYQEAIPYLDKAIQQDEKFAYAFNNRGLAKIKSGQEDEGLLDIHNSLVLDNQNSYAYRNLGIYHLDKGDSKKALNLFQKAQELDPETYLIEKLILSAKKM